MSDINVQIQEVQYLKHIKKIVSRHITIKLLKTQWQSEKIQTAARGIKKKDGNFPISKYGVRREWSNIFKSIDRKETVKPEFHTKQKYLSKSKGKTDFFFWDTKAEKNFNQFNVH